MIPQVVVVAEVDLLAVAKKYLEHEKYSMRRSITTYVASLTHFHVFVSIFDKYLYMPAQVL